MARVFVSYAHQDLDRAQKVVAWLREEGHDVFMDRDRQDGIVGGEPWKPRLYRQLRQADAVVCVVTRAFVASRWCSGEVWIADALLCPLVPLLFEPRVDPPLVGSSVHHIDCTADLDVAPDELLRALYALDRRGRTRWREGRNPFPGLEAFTAELSDLFFGRSDEGRELAGRVRAVAAGGILAVIGPSGCGKSSLVRAKLLPHMGSDLDWVVLPPWMPGDDPLYALASAVVSGAAAIGLEWSHAQVLERLETASGLRRVVDDLLRADGQARHVLITVDQAEELFTQTMDEGLRGRLALLLKEAVAGAAQVVLTLRSIFLDDLRMLPGLVEVPLDVYALAPLSAEMLRLAIEEPARIAGLKIDAELVANLVGDTGSGEALPLLAFTLQQLADGLSRGDTISAERYAGLGGVRGALSQRADAAHRAAVAHSGLDERQVLSALVWLTALDDTGRRTRRRVDYSGLPDATRTAMDAFVDHRLLTTTRDRNGTWIAVAHEALLTAWPPLDEAISEHTVVLHTIRSVERAAEEWIYAGRADHFLWDEGKRFTATLDRLSLDAGDLSGSPHVAGLTWNAQNFLLTCLDRVRVRTRHERRRRRSRWTALVLVSTIVVVAVTTAVLRDQQAKLQRDIATARRLVAQAEVARNTSPELALRLGIAAHSLNPDDEVNESLVDTLARTSYTRRITGFKGPVVDVEFRHNTSTLAMGVSANENTVALWDVGSVPEVRPLAPPLDGHRQPVRQTAFSPDGNTLATASADHTVRLWDTGDPTTPRPRTAPLDVHEGSVNAVAFRPDGRVLATASHDKTVVLWDVNEPDHPKPLKTLVGHTNGVETASFSADGRLLATGGRDGTVILWDTTDPTRAEAIKTLTAHKGARVTSATFAPTGRTLATGGIDQTVILWDLADPSAPRQWSPPVTAHEHAIDAITFSPDARTLATGSMDTTVVLWDVTDPSLPRQLGEPLVGHTNVVSDIAFASDGHTLATSSWDDSVILWDIANAVEPLDGHAGAVNTVAFNRSGSLLATASSDKTVVLWDVAIPSRPRRSARLTDFTGAVVSLAFSPDGNTLVTASRDNSVILWDVTEAARPERLGAPLAGHRWSVGNLAFSPDGDLLATAGADAPESVAGNHSIVVWDVTTPATPRQLSPPLRGHANFINAIAFKPDSRTLASADASGVLFLWDVTDPTAFRQLGPPFKSYSGLVTSLAFGDTLATGGWNGAVVLWDVSDPNQTRELGRAPTGHINSADDLAWWPNTVESVAFDATGRTLAAASEEGTITLWNTSDPTRPHTLGTALKFHRKAVNTVAFHDGRPRLATGGADRSVVLWDLTKFNDLRDHAVDRACERAGRGLTIDEWRRYVGTEPGYRRDRCAD